MRNGTSGSVDGAGTCATTASKSGAMSVPATAGSSEAQPSRAEQYTTGKSSCASVAPKASNRSNTASCTASGRASGRSILLIATIGRRPRRSALSTTNLVWGIGPSAASTRTSAPSTMPSTRSTSPPKSTWPGVSTMSMRTPCHWIAVHLARIVMPRSRSSSPRSMARSCIGWFARTVPLWRSRQSTSVVLP